MPVGCLEKMRESSAVFAAMLLVAMLLALVTVLLVPLEVVKMPALGAGSIVFCTSSIRMESPTGWSAGFLPDSGSAERSTSTRGDVVAGALGGRRGERNSEGKRVGDLSGDEPSTGGLVAL